MYSENENVHAFSITEYKPQNTGTRATTDGSSYIIDMRPVAKHVLCCDSDKERDEWVQSICLEILKYRPRDAFTLRELDSFEKEKEKSRQPRTDSSKSNEFETRSRSSSYNNPSSSLSTVTSTVTTTASSVLSTTSANSNKSLNQEKPELPPRKIKDSSSVLESVQALKQISEVEKEDSDEIQEEEDEEEIQEIQEEEETKETPLDAKQLARQAILFIPSIEESEPTLSMEWKMLKDQIGIIKTISNTPTTLQDMNNPVKKSNNRSAIAIWNYIKGKEGNKTSLGSVPPRIFGVSLAEAVSVSNISDSFPLPAVVYRCIEFLETKRVWEEEGIYRLSGSSTEILTLKALFEQELDVDLVTSLEYHDPHAIAGLLKCYFRELPTSLFSKESKSKLVSESMNDFENKQEYLYGLKESVNLLPALNYFLLKALMCHLYKIVQESLVNKMNLRNMSIVFSPTLGIPAGMFMLLISEYESVFTRVVSMEEWSKECV